MTTYTITAAQLAAVRTQRKQLLDSPHKNDHAAAALLNWAETLQPAAAPSLGSTKTLTSEHQGMRVNYSGLLGQCQRALALGEGSHSALAEMLRQLQGHLQELGRRWYAGDVAVVDELLQLYCVEAEARAALKAAAPKSAQSTEVAREALYRAAIGCPHELDHNKVVLHFDPRRPGHNALDQLSRRLEAVAASSQGADANA